MIVVLDSALSSVFGTADSLVASVSTVQFLMCCVASIVLGAAVACIYMFRHKYSKNFVVTLALLPLIVQMVITLVNGNLGAGIAVMGVFNLVRFRSIPGSAKETQVVVRTDGRMHPEPGSVLRLTVAEKHLHVFDPKDGARLSTV